MPDKWINEAVSDEGRVTDYLRRVYGDEAFTEDGDIKMSYINKAIDRIKNGEGKNVEGILQALHLAKRLKRM